MFAIALAALLSATPAISPALFDVPAVRSSSTVVLRADTPAQIIEKARAAQAAGDLTTARQEFMRAIRLQRADGVLSVDASYGAANVLAMQEKFRDAADVLDQLAADANLLGDAETEARVLLDVVSLKVTHHRAAAARPDAHRLKELVTDVRLTSDTRKLIMARFS